MTENAPYVGGPKGRIAENNSIIPNSYSLQETETANFDERTKLNIRDSDGTLIVIPQTQDQIADGTILTIEEVKAKSKPFLIIDLTQSATVIAQWIYENKIEVLNIAGPKESTCPGIYKASYNFFQKIFPVVLQELEYFISKNLY